MRQITCSWHIRSVWPVDSYRFLQHCCLFKNFRMALGQLQHTLKALNVSNTDAKLCVQTLFVQILVITPIHKERLHFIYSSDNRVRSEVEVNIRQFHWRSHSGGINLTLAMKAGWGSADVDLSSLVPSLKLSDVMWTNDIRVFLQVVMHYWADGSCLLW